MFLSSWNINTICSKHAVLTATISAVKFNTKSQYLPSRYNKRINTPLLHVGYFRRALILFIEGHIAFKDNRAQASAFIGCEMFQEEWLIGVVCLKHQFKYVLPPLYPFIFSPSREVLEDQSHKGVKDVTLFPFK